MKPIYIFGHKNPDTDSVCSAISLAHLKNELNENCVPKVIGPMNRETQFVLDYFKVDYPSYLNDVKVQISDMKYTKKAYINEKESIHDAFELMKTKDLTALPLVNDKRKITGYVSLKDMAKFLISGKKDFLNTNLKHLLLTLNAKIITNFKNDFTGRIFSVAFSSESFISEVELEPTDILIVGDRFKVLDYAINKKVGLIILAKDRMITPKLLNLAVKNKVNIISTSYNSYEIASRLILANYVWTINENKNPLTIGINSYYTDFVALTKKYNYTNYPVVRENGECVGVLKLTDATEYERKKVMLVDHNNYEQSIDGINEAEILEIFDHHNLGNIGTNVPIYFTCQPVGCTATIIYNQYKKERVAIPKHIAGLLLSAILSDTLLFTSPTTTETDKIAAEELAKIAKVNVNNYGIQMLKAASSIKGLSVSELINQDFKQYNVNGLLYGIAVITTMDYEEIENHIEDYTQKLNEMSQNAYEGVMIFVTDVIKKGSYVLFNDESKSLLEMAFNQKIKEGDFLDGIVSRKKQILPAILKVLDN